MSTIPALTRGRSSARGNLGVTDLDDESARGGVVEMDSSGVPERREGMRARRRGGECC